MLLTLFFFYFNTFAHGQNYDLYEPTTAHKVPVLIYVHGGAWISGQKEQYQAIAQALTRENFCVAVAEYGLAPQHQHPEPVQDLQTVLQKLKTLKSKKCDAQKIFLFGHSAGAHMIAFWSTLYSDQNIKGFIGIEGIYDLPNLLKVWPDYKVAFISSAFGETKYLALASPTRLKIKGPSPWLILHSEKDELVDVAQSMDFHQHLLNQKLSSELVLLKAENHFGVIESLKKRDSSATKALIAFVKKKVN